MACGMRLKKNLGLMILCLYGPSGCLIGQTIVEHAAISGGTATVAGSAKSAAETISRALKSLDGTLDTAVKKNPVAVSSQPSKPSVKIYEDPAGIKAGMSFTELLRRFGEPSMTVSGENGEQTLFYLQKDGGQTPVHVLGGKVVAATVAVSSSID
jgi:hypothetical protein